MGISEVQRAQLEMAREYCDEKDKSTEFMIQYMQDMAGVDYDAVIDFLVEDAEKQDERPAS